MEVSFLSQKPLGLAVRCPGQQVSSQHNYTAGHGFVSQEPQVHLAHTVVLGGEEK